MLPVEPMFISYAQNLEDVMLYRALSHVERGFYIDVGAHDPVADSVTKAFYDRGWSGINIEPTGEMHRRLIDARPRDVNIRCGASSRSGYATFYSVPDCSALSTFDPVSAGRVETEGRSIKTETLQVQTLDDICEEHRDSREIHFLKIDVEGHEQEVLRGFSLARHRPWIVVAEAYNRYDDRRRRPSWADLLRRERYIDVYCDGLNCFFVAVEHRDLAEAFGTPPNVFDGWVRSSEVLAEQRAALAEGGRALAWAQLEEAQQRVTELERQMQEAQIAK